VDVAIERIRKLMSSALALRGIGGADADFIIDDYLDAHLEGKATHGMGKFLLIDGVLSDREGQPETQNRHGATALVDGHREVGQLAARYSTNLAVEIAREYGVGLVGLRNFARFGRLEPYGRMMSTAGLVGMVLNSAGPPAVVPFGATKPLLGTNPVCFAFPSNENGIVVDFSTAERVWGEIRQATLEHKPLPEGAFLDSNGKPTVDPEQADGVIPFGGHKGFALCLSLELMAGVLTRTAVGNDVTTEYDLGALFFAVNPSAIAPGVDAASLADGLAQDVRALPTQPEVPSVLIPGDRSAATRAQAIAAGVISVDEETMNHLEAMSTSASGGLASTDKLN
jgi:L-2-hydroxycarboxylate dehydrogenase (NAD+)